MRVSDPDSEPLHSTTGGPSAAVSANPRALLIAYLCLTLSVFVSRYDRLSLVLVIIGLVGGRTLIQRGARTATGKAALLVLVFWLLYGLTIGSMPSLAAPIHILTWLTSEGRAILPLLVVVLASGTPSAEAVTRAIRATTRLMVVLVIPLLVAFEGGLQLVRIGKNFSGLTSSHHVPGFLFSVIALGLIFIPGIYRTAAARAAALLIVGSVVMLSGSRSSWVGLLAVGAFHLTQSVSPRVLVRRVAIASLAAIVLLSASERLRITVNAFTSSDFLAIANQTFDARDPDSARSRGLGAERANILIRVGLFGVAVDAFKSSPLIGEGIWRFNDTVTGHVGTKGVFWVATSGLRVHTDAQPHNMYLYLASEGGLVGLVLFVRPYATAWRRTKRRRPVGPRNAGGLAGPWSMACRSAIVFGFFGGLGSAAILSTGMGIPVNLLVFTSLQAVIRREPARFPEVGAQ